MNFTIKSAVQGALKRVSGASRDLELRAGKPISPAVFAKMNFAATQGRRAAALAAGSVIPGGRRAPCPNR